MIDTPQSVHGTKFDDYYSGNSGTDCDELAHFAGRACYQSWHMPNPVTSDAEGYISNIISQGHFSVLEHASATFYVEGVSRSLTHELVRHRHLSYSELSQRYVNMDDSIITVPPAIDKNLGIGSIAEMGRHQRESIQLYNKLVEKLESVGIKGKKAREAARAVMPGGVETAIVVTGNMRAWRDMLHKRYSVHADAEIREFSGLVLQELQKIAPASFQDFPDEPFQ
jgi:thymidylate synthase (FAD)